MSGEFAKNRRVMTDSQIRARGVRDPLVLAAVNKVPRHLFVPDGMRGSAYADELSPHRPALKIAAVQARRPIFSRALLGSVVQFSQAAL